MTSPKVQSEPVSAPPPVVAIGAASITPSSAASIDVNARAGIAVVEVTAADGRRMTVHMPVGSFDLSKLVHDFGRAA